MPNIRDLLFDQATQQRLIRAFCSRLQEVADGAQSVHAEHSTEVSAEILDRAYPTPLQHTYLVLFIMAICEDELTPQIADPPSLVRAYFGREGLRRRLERAVCGTPQTPDAPARPSLTPVQIVSAEWMRSVFAVRVRPLLVPALVPSAVPKCVLSGPGLLRRPRRAAEPRLLKVHI